MVSVNTGFKDNTLLRTFGMVTSACHHNRCLLTHDFFFVCKGKHNQGTAVLHQCHICLRKFKKKIDRDRHLFVHNIRGLPNIHECDLCDYTASRRRYMEAHFHKHHVVYICAECNSKFPSSVRLNHHLNQVHGVSESSENWMQVFQACIASSLYLPEPDGSTDGLFGDLEGDTDQVAHLLQVKGNDEVTEVDGQKKAVVTEPIQLLGADTDLLIGREGQAAGQVVGDSRVVDGNEMVVLPPKDPTECSPLKGEGQAGGEPGRLPGEHGVVTVAAGDQPVEGDPANDVEEQNGDGVEDLETMEDYDIYKRLGYAHMTWDVFHKLRGTFGTEECEFCGRLFYSKSDFNTHFRSHTG